MVMLLSFHFPWCQYTSFSLYDLYTFLSGLVVYYYTFWTYVFLLDSSMHTVCMYFIYLFGLTTRHAGFKFPDKGLNPCPLWWECGLLTIAPTGKPLYVLSLQDLIKVTVWTCLFILSYKSTLCSTCGLHVDTCSSKQ